MSNLCLKRKTLVSNVANLPLSQGSHQHFKTHVTIFNSCQKLTSITKSSVTVVYNMHVHQAWTDKHNTKKTGISKYGI